MSPRAVVALAIIAVTLTMTRGAEEPGTTSQRPDADAERLELQSLIEGRQTTLRLAAPDHLSSMLNEEEWNEDLVARINRFLAKHSADPAREQFLLAKLEAIYVAGTLRGRSLDRLEREVKSILHDETAPRLREAAEYWLMRLEWHRAGEESLAGKSLSDIRQKGIESFVKSHPKSSEAAGLLDELFNKAVTAGDLKAADQWLAVLRENHPSHVTTLAASGAMSLLRQIGREWRPNWKTSDGKPAATPDIHGSVGLTIFFSAKHSPSVEVLEKAAALRDRPGEPLAVTAVALDANCDLATATLKRLKIDRPLVCDGEGWKSSLCSQWGIRNLPTVLLTDEAGVLRHVVTPRRGEVWPIVEQSIREMRRPKATATSRASDDQSK